MRTVLFVDDNHLNLKLFRSFVSHIGYEGHGIDDPREVVEATRRLAPVAIFMDICMPGMSGIEAAAALKASGDTADVPIYALTALPPDEVPVSTGDTLFKAVLRKPVSIDEVEKAILASHEPA